MTNFISDSMTDNAVLLSQVEELRKENAALRAEISAFKPELELELDFEERAIVGQLKQFGKVIQAVLPKVDADYYNEAEQAKMFSQALSELFANYLEKQAVEQLRVINGNIERFREKALW